MADLGNRKATTLLAVVVTALIVGLNAVLVYRTLAGAS
jgi:Mn2+/Fe2+ NRAMP family transporter